MFLKYGPKGTVMMNKKDKNREGGIYTCKMTLPFFPYLNQSTIQSTNEKISSPQRHLKVLEI
jgi:hypothetical protein